MTTFTQRSKQEGHTFHRNKEPQPLSKHHEKLQNPNRHRPRDALSRKAEIAIPDILSEFFLTPKASSKATKLRCTIRTAGDVWLCGLKFAVCPAEFKAYMGNTDLVLLRPLLAIILHIPLEHRLSPESFKHQPRKIKLINKSQTQVQVNNLINAKEGA